MSNIVHVVGTGTIGEPRIGLLCDLKNSLGIDEVTFYKHSPILTDKPKVKGLLRRGGILTVRKEKDIEVNDLLMWKLYLVSLKTTKTSKDLCSEV